jgi:hypothetical protein
MMSASRVPIQGFHDPKRDVTFAWLSLLLYPLSFGAAFLIGEGLATWLFDWPNGANPAPWKIVAAGVPAVIVFALPVVPAWYFGMRAHRNGSHSGRVAGWVAVAIAAAFVVQNGLGFLVGFLFG